MLLPVLPYCVTGVWMLNGSTLAGLSEELMADSTFQMVQTSHVHLEDDALGTSMEYTMSL